MKAVDKTFSQELDEWSKAKGDSDLRSLTTAFEEKAFAILFMLLMALPALPIPTGGLTHVTEVLAVIGALQLLAGRKTIWLPKFSRKYKVSRKIVVGLLKIVRWFERYSRPRLGSLLNLTVVRSLIGLMVIIFTVAAFVAPPFSGLDTLPSLGVVIISLSLVLEDIIVFAAGFVIGCVGIGLELAAGTALYSGLTHLF